jgi:hypothetical protein
VARGCRVRRATEARSVNRVFDIIGAAKAGAMAARPGRNPAALRR